MLSWSLSSAGLWLHVLLPLLILLSVTNCTERNSRCHTAAYFVVEIKCWSYIYSQWQHYMPMFASYIIAPHCKASWSYYFETVEILLYYILCERERKKTRERESWKISSDSWKCIVEMNERMKFYFFIQKYTILTFIYTFLPIHLYINIRINILMYL